MKDDEYLECKECGYVGYPEKFEFADAPKIRCPKCGNTDIESLDEDSK